MGAALVEVITNDLARVLIAVVLLVGTLALLVMGKDVPAVLWALDSSAVTFYFTVSIVAPRLR